MTPGPWGYLVRRDGSVWIGMGPDCAFVTKTEFTEADACLIAAAPDLLAALKRILIWLECDPHCDTADAEEFVRNAIAKAEGWP